MRARSRGRAEAPRNAGGRRLNALAIVVLAALVAAFASACGSHYTRKLGFDDCVNAWNGADNVRRQRTMGLIRDGYAHAGVQMSETTGVPMGGPDPNPVGCRVVLSDSKRWIAFLARRDGNEFRFRPALLGAEEGDQSGVWPAGASHGPQNARLIGDGKLVMRPWVAVLTDWFDNGRIDGSYACAVAHAAVAQLPADGPTVGGPLRTYESKVC